MASSFSNQILFQILPFCAPASPQTGCMRSRKRFLKLRSTAPLHPRPALPSSRPPDTGTACETRTSFSRPNFSCIWLEILQIFSLPASHYTSATPASLRDPHRMIKISTFPLWTYFLLTDVRIAVSKKFRAFFGIRILTSRYRWLTPFISTMNFFSASFRHLTASESSHTFDHNYLFLFPCILLPSLIIRHLELSPSTMIYCKIAMKKQRFYHAIRIRMMMNGLSRRRIPTGISWHYHCKIVAEQQTISVDGRIAKIAQPESDELLLTIKT